MKVVIWLILSAAVSLASFIAFVVAVGFMLGVIIVGGAK